jgi:hypothetical protein
MAVKKPLKHVETDTATQEIPTMSRDDDRKVYEATYLPAGDSELSLDPDAEASFQDWAEALGESRSAYIIRAYRLPTDKDGRIQGNASSGQMISLGAWPLDSIKYDELIELLRNEYMLPGTSVMAVRLMVTQEGSRGVKKNQIVQIQRALRTSTVSGAAQKESVSEMMRAMQENNQAMMQQFAQMMAMSKSNIPAQPARDPFDMMTAMMGAMAPFITAIAGRPQPQGQGLGEMVDVLVKLKGLTGSDDNSGGDDGNNLVGIIKAAVPLAQPLLTTIAANAQTQAANATLQANNSAHPQRQLPAPAAQRNISPTQSAQVVQPISDIAPPQPGAPVQPVMTYFEGKEVPMFMLQIRPQIQQLCDLAAQVPQPDPAEVANMTLDQIPEEYDDKLGELLFNENFMKWLAMLDSRVNDHRQWFDTLHATMKKAFENPDEETQVQS